MSRPGFTLAADERTATTLVVRGVTPSLQRVAPGTQVAYPADPGEWRDSTPMVEDALDRPLSGAPLAERLGPDTRLTVVVGGPESVRPVMQQDARRVVVEHVLERAARAGVRDVAVLVATGLDRRPGRAQLLDLLGERVVRSLWERGLVVHDCTAGDCVELGEVDDLPVRVHPRLAASDVVVNVLLRGDARQVAADQLCVGLGDAATIDALAGLAGSADRRAAAAALVAQRADVLDVEVVLSNPILPHPLTFIGRREWEWSLRDRAELLGVRQALAVAPRQAAQRFFGRIDADYRVDAVVAGTPQEAAEAGVAAWLAGHRVPVAEQADVLVASVWGSGADPTAPAGDPISAAHDGLVVQGESFRVESPVREGGAFIGLHPLTDQFSSRHRGAAGDFFADVLSHTRDSQEIREQFQDSFSSDSWYLDLYRTRHAFHPLQVFHEWYATARAASHYSCVVWVGASRSSARRMGFRAGSTLDDALEIVSDSIGTDATVTVLHPGAQMCLELG